MNKLKLKASGEGTSSAQGETSKADVGPWDPLWSADWDKETHTKEAILRIKRDLQTIFIDPPPGICVIPNGDDLTTLHAIIVGPFDTPYEGGLFHFLLRFPPNYPLQPPRVKFMTTGGYAVRFNPNLYKNGKVCLSILGTWKGPPWSEVQSLQSVLLSIQTLLNDKPYHNEPGYHREQNYGESDDYNDVIVHETLRVAVCDAIERPHSQEQLQELNNSSFLESYGYYLSTAKRLSVRLDGQAMKDPFGFNKGTFDFKSIIHRLQTLHDQLKHTK